MPEGMIYRGVKATPGPRRHSVIVGLVMVVSGLALSYGETPAKAHHLMAAASPPAVPLPDVLGRITTIVLAIGGIGQTAYVMWSNWRNKRVSDLEKQVKEDREAYEKQAREQAEVFATRIKIRDDQIEALTRDIDRLGRRVESGLETERAKTDAQIGALAASQSPSNVTVHVEAAKP